MKKRTLFSIILPTFILLASFVMKGDDGLKIGKKIPMMNVKMVGIDDQEYSLQGLMEETGLVVVFSCNTCPFVVGNDSFEGWEKQYNELYKKAKNAGLGFVLINSNEAKRDGDDSLEKMKEHAKEMGYKMNYLVDADSKLADAFGAKTTPHVFVINKLGKLAYKGSIDNSWDSKRTEDRPYLSEVIEALKNSTELRDEMTQPRGCSIKRN